MDFQSSGTSPLYGDIDEETRGELIEMLGLREVALGHQRELLRMKMDQLRNPTQLGGERIERYEREAIGPIDLRLAELWKSLMEKAVDVEGLKEAAPLAVMSLMRHVNLPLVMQLLDMSADRAQLILSKLREFYEEGFR